MNNIKNFNKDLKYGYSIDKWLATDSWYNESWKPIFQYEDCYLISDFGRIKSLKHNKIMKPAVSFWKYLTVNLRKNQKLQGYLIHRLVAIAFIENIENKLEINHKDGFKNNNHISNLEWVSRSENCKHGYNIGLIKMPTSKGDIGILHPRSKPVAQIMPQTKEIIAVYGGTKEAERILGIDSGSIRSVALLRPHHNTFKGFIWRYIDREKYNSIKNDKTNSPRMDTKNVVN